MKSKFTRPSFISDKPEDVGVQFMWDLCVLLRRLGLVSGRATAAARKQLDDVIDRIIFENTK